jgi:hypothetical protein
MKRLSILALLALAAPAAARDSNIKWMKFDEALQKAGTTGQPVCVFVAVNPNGSS